MSISTLNQSRTASTVASRKFLLKPHGFLAVVFTVIFALDVISPMVVAVMLPDLVHRVGNTYGAGPASVGVVVFEIVLFFAGAVCLKSVWPKEGSK